MRRFLGLSIGLVTGGILGHYRFFCPGGTCPLTSTWLGGAVIGGLLVVSAKQSVTYGH